MMGRRERLIDGDEYDALTRGGRRVHRSRIVVPRHRTLSPGVARAIAKAAGWKEH